MAMLARCGFDLDRALFSAARPRGRFHVGASNSALVRAAPPGLGRGRARAARASRVPVGGAEPTADVGLGPGPRADAPLAATRRPPGRLRPAWCGRAARRADEHELAAADAGQRTVRGVKQEARARARRRRSFCLGGAPRPTSSSGGRRRRPWRTSRRSRRGAWSTSLPVPAGPPSPSLTRPRAWDRENPDRRSVSSEPGWLVSARKVAGALHLVAARRL